MASGAASADRWVSDVSSLVRAELRRRVAALRATGGDPSSLGTPAELAERMLATVPEPTAWNVLGPFYSTRGMGRVLGGVSRQAIEDRRRRHRLIALQTAEGTWVYPTFQLDGRNQPIESIVAAHRRLTVGRIDAWSAAAALLGPQPELGGRSIVEHLRDGGPQEPVDDLLGTTVASLA